MHTATQSVGDNAGLRTLACIGVNNADLTDDGIAAARRLSGQSPLAGDRSLLSYVIYQSANNSYLDSIFAKDNSDEKRKALQEQQTFLGQAEAEASAVRQSQPGRRDVLAAYVLGSIYEDKSSLNRAVPLFEEVFASNFSYCGNDLSLSSLRSLISDSNALGRPADAEKWFRTLVRNYQPTAYEWDSEGDRRAKENDFVLTADAYERAASGADSLKIDVCYATSDRWLSPGDNDDAILQDGRLCEAAAASNTDKKKVAEFDRTLPLVHRLIGRVLQRRGVHEAALAEVKESLSEKPADPWALLLEADIYADTQQFAECISAASAAIQASDGKFADMHFRLGYCYSQSGNLVRAEDSYRRAAETDPKDPVSAYDLALVLKQEGYLSDAKHWFEEALKRNPSAEIRVQIESAMPR
jgi:tetratricopeptide (TPR) repeat protein